MPEEKPPFSVFQSVTNVWGRRGESWRYQLSNMACLQSVKRGTKAHVSTIVYRQYICTIAPLPYNLVSYEKQWLRRSLHKRYSISAFMYLWPSNRTALAPSAKKKNLATLKFWFGTTYINCLQSVWKRAINFGQSLWYIIKYLHTCPLSGWHDFY